MNMPKFLTIQKPDRYFSISGFSVALKPEPFDGSFYKRWRSRMILWLIAMNCSQVAQGKPKLYTPEEESRFEAADNLFRGGVISALAEKYVDSYLS